MHKERVEKLRQEYTDQLVTVEPARPELARFAGMTGRVRTISFNGTALVEFDGLNNHGWYDVELDYLKVVEPSTSEEPEPATTPDNEIKPSPLELARAAKDAKQNPPPTESTTPGE